MTGHETANDESTNYLATGTSVTLCLEVRDLYRDCCRLQNITALIIYDSTGMHIASLIMSFDGLSA